MSGYGICFRVDRQLILFDLKTEAVYYLYMAQSILQGGCVRTRLFISTLTVVLTMSCSLTAVAQQRVERQTPAPAPRVAGWQPMMLIDCPTAGTLKRGYFNVIMQAYPGGGIMAGTNIGMSNRITLGISYGGAGIISENKPNWDQNIQFNIKLSLIDEGIAFPALSVGFCSQGSGAYDDSLNRYDFKSKGFYGVASKTYAYRDREFGVHGGLNYSMEQDDGDKNADFFLGLDSRLNHDVGLVMEYDFALNDDKHIYGDGRGYLNLSIQWLYAENLVMEFMLKNLTNNRVPADALWRGFRVTYVEHF